MSLNTQWMLSSILKEQRFVRLARVNSPSTTHFVGLQLRQQGVQWYKKTSVCISWDEAFCCYEDVTFLWTMLPMDPSELMCVLCLGKTVESLIRNRLSFKPWWSLTRSRTTGCLYFKSLLCGNSSAVRRWKIENIFEVAFLSNLCMELPGWLPNW